MKGMKSMEREKILITCDSTADLPPELVKKYGIKVLPLNVTLGGSIYHDGVDVTPQDIFSFAATRSMLPKTTEPTLDETFKFFAPLVRQGYEIIHFTISAELSKSYINADINAKKLGHIHVIDTRTATCAEGMIVLNAAKMLEEGHFLNEIIDSSHFMIGKVRATCVVDKMDFLYKGGRCSAVARFGATMFNIKPNIIVTKDGKLDVDKKYRGRFNESISKFLTEELSDGKSIDDDTFFIVHTGADSDILEMCENRVKNIVSPKHLYTVKSGCTIATHLGPNVVILVFLKKFGGSW